MEDLQGDMSAKLQKCRLLEGEWSHWDDLFWFVHRHKGYHWGKDGYEIRWPSSSISKSSLWKSTEMQITETWDLRFA
jgi:hypothetical protein